ncbi:MAG: NapC/NirT family cytochrome c [Nitrospirae bacterium]|nr:NapC/NirT family cytochrome c [Nitrospirota bacterium]
MKDVLEKIKVFARNNPKSAILIFTLAFFLSLAIFIFIFVESLHISSEPKFCEFCHPEKKTGPFSEVYTWSKNIHATQEVKCLDCHGKPGLTGYMKAKFGGLRDIYGFVMYSHEHMSGILTKAATDPKYASEIVPNEICLFCHTDSYNQKIRKERIMSAGVKFRLMDSVKNPEFRKSKGLRDILTEELKSEVNLNHKKHLDAGINCLDCHLGVAHGGEYKNTVKTERCVNCHEKRKSEISMSDLTFNAYGQAVIFSHKSHNAMFKCDECHPDIFQMRKGSSKITFADHTKQKLCYSCHNNKKAPADCKTCHVKVPVPKPITYKVTGISPASFSHEFHTMIFKCNDCHTKIWPMKKGIKKMTMDSMSQGKFCGSCHNSKVAFESTECERCHTSK